MKHSLKLSIWLQVMRWIYLQITSYVKFPGLINGKAVQLHILICSSGISGVGISILTIKSSNIDIVLAPFYTTMT